MAIPASVKGGEGGGDRVASLVQAGQLEHLAHSVQTTCQHHSIIECFNCTMPLPFAGKVEGAGAGVIGNKLRGLERVLTAEDKQPLRSDNGIVIPPAVPEGRSFPPSLSGKSVTRGIMANKHGAPHPGNARRVVSVLGKVGEDATLFPPRDPQLHRFFNPMATRNQQPWGGMNRCEQ